MATKQDYELIANAIATEIDLHDDIDKFKASSILTWIIGTLCREFAQDNPNFNKELFILATKINEHRARNMLHVTSIDELTK